MTNGYVYQKVKNRLEIKKSLKNLFFKAYLEFFTSENNIPVLRAVFKKIPNVNYHFVNKSVRIFVFEILGRK